VDACRGVHRLRGTGVGRTCKYEAKYGAWLPSVPAAGVHTARNLHVGAGPQRK
jgi:hypothetical protein